MDDAAGSLASFLRRVECEVQGQSSAEARRARSDAINRERRAEIHFFCGEGGGTHLEPAAGVVTVAQ